MTTTTREIAELRLLLTEAMHIHMRALSDLRAANESRGKGKARRVKNAQNAVSDSLATVHRLQGAIRSARIMADD